MKTRLIDRLPGVLVRNSLSGWVVFTRESAPDPLAAHFGGGDAVARMALVFGTMDGGFRRIAICASYDVTPLEESGLYDQVVSYRDEGARPHLAEWLACLVPGDIGINASRDIPAADGLAAGMRDYLVTAVDPKTAGRLKSAERFVVDLLSTRSSEEIALIEEAAKRTQQVMLRAMTREHVTAGETTEKDLEQVFQGLVDDLGDHLEFLSINVGPTRGHSTPTDRVIAPGDLLRVDFGVRHRGWCADVQRTAYVLDAGESAVPRSIERMWSVSREAFKAALGALRPGATGLDVDTAARAVVEAAGLEGYPHAAGHGVGSEVHAIGPILGPDWPERYGTAVKLPIRENQVFAVEPIVYAPDPKTGAIIHIGLEDDVAVTADGCRLLGETQERIWLI